MVRTDIPLNESKSYIEEKIVSVSRKTGIQKEIFFRTTFEEIEKKLGITDERILEGENTKLQNPGKIKGSIYTHFASPLSEKDVIRKQKYIDKFISRRGMGK
jgi:hypothetical protein